MLKPGDEFERYTIEACIGQGGMGAVYRARDARLGRRVAIKVMGESVGTEASVRLLREARAAAALDHPNAVAVFDVAEREGVPYIVMELVEGCTLRSAIERGDGSVAEKIAELADVGRALASAHRHGVIHRDVKPENVMVRSDGVVKVLDFGIARRTTGSVVDPSGATEMQALATLTIDGVKLGTPVYMAPEQIRGDALDGRADQFSWAVMAYERLTGRLPWRGTDALAAMASALTDPVDRAPLEQNGVAPPVQEVLLRALAKDPAQRFADMDEAVSSLEAAARGEVPEVPKVSSATAAQRFTTGEVREVLEKAIEREAAEQGSTKLRFDDLLAVGAEVGIDAESLREASRALRMGRDAAPQAEIVDARERDAWIRRRRRAFTRHAGIYAIVNAALVILGVILSAWTPFWVWLLPALGWGIGLAIHGLVALTSNEDDWAEEKAGMKWWREERRRRHEERMAARGARRQHRIVEAPADANVRVAVTDDAEVEEAAAAEHVNPRRRQRSS